MTERLYYSVPMLSSCEAEVLSCEKCESGFEVVLDRTVIFPEGGGQPADHGTIGPAMVLDAKERDGEVIHICSRPLEAGSKEKVTLDLARRLDHTEQHTGEHILSGLAFKLFGARNVGFHMAEDYCTIDLDKYLSEEALSMLEAAANEAVRGDLPVTDEHMDHERLAEIAIRKKSEIVSDDIRVVYIAGGDVDSCTCCGTHFESTGRVGYIRIGDSQKYKGGTRLWFSCGGRAVREANEIAREMTAMARGYSTSREELPAALRKQSEELANAKRELKARTKALCENVAKEHTGGAAVLMMEGFGANDVKMLSEALVENGADIALVFGRSEGRTNYRALRKAGEKESMNELIKAVNGLLCGKGGGSADFAQGASTEPVTCEMLETLEKLIKDRSKSR